MMTAEEIHENLLFKQYRILNLEGVNLDTPVYRVFPIDRLIQLFTARKNTLVKPRLWDDPFENLVFQQTAKTSTGENVSFDKIREKYYGQCWTLNQDETDALWRIYSPNKNGVRVKTTLRKLWNNFYNPKHIWAMTAFFVGKINYATEQEIKDYFEKPENLSMIFDSSGEGAIQTLLIKRMEFLHENEIRLIYNGNAESHDLTQMIYQYDIDPNDLLDELLFDPRFEDTDYVTKSDQLKSFGYVKTIAKSKLYQLPNFNLRLNH